MRNDRDEAWAPSPCDRRDGMARVDWGEEDREAFPARQDVLLERHRELSETLGDHPQRGPIIGRQMHGDLPEVVVGAPCPEGCEESEARGDEPKEDIESVPVLRLAKVYARALARFLGVAPPGPAQNDGGEDGDGRLATDAAAGALARLADGHGFGCERGPLCGNIVRCKRALAAPGASLDALGALLRRRALPPSEGEALLRQGRELHEAGARRIEEFRLRTWWS